MRKMIVKRTKNRRLNKKRETRPISRRSHLYEQAAKVNMQHMEKCFAALDAMTKACRATAVLTD